MNTSNQKPHLMGGAGAARTTKDGAVRILSHLEHGVPRPSAKPRRTSGWTIDGWTAGLGALLLLMCSVAWLMHEKTITPASFKSDHSGGTNVARSELRSHAEQVASAMMPAAAASTAVAVSGTAAQVLPANIVNDPIVASTNMSALPIMPTAQPAKAAPSVVAPTKLAARATHIAATAAVKPKPAKPVAGKSPNTGDPDVALLTALVAHSKAPTTAEGAVDAPQSSTTTKPAADSR